MVLKYRDVRTDRVVEMPEPPDVLAETERAAEEMAAKGTKKAKAEAEFIAEAGVKQAGHVRRTIERMDESDVWERVHDEDEQAEADPEPPAPAAEPPAPDLAAVRAWAKTEGIEVSDRGNLPKDLIDRWRAATGG